MNLPGSYQRIEARSEGQKGGALRVAFRSRPAFANAIQIQAGNAPHLRRGQRRDEWVQNTPAWRASVWDEVQATANGALLRRIKILITDGTQLGQEQTAWG